MSFCCGLHWLHTEVRQTGYSRLHDFSQLVGLRGEGQDQLLLKCWCLLSNHKNWSNSPYVEVTRKWKMGERHWKWLCTALGRRSRKLVISFENIIYLLSVYQLSSTYHISIYHLSVYSSIIYLSYIYSSIYLSSMYVCMYVCMYSFIRVFASVYGVSRHAGVQVSIYEWVQRPKEDIGFPSLSLCLILLKQSL